MDQLLVDEVLVAQLFDVVVDREVRVVGGEPVLAQVGLFLVEAEVDLLVVFLVVVDEGDRVLGYLLEVLLGLFVGRGSQSFVVFYRPG